MMNMFFQRNKETVWDFWQKMKYAVLEAIPEIVKSLMDQKIVQQWSQG